MSVDAPTDHTPPGRTWPARLQGLGLLAACLLLAGCLVTYQVGEMGWDFLNPNGGEAAHQAPCTNLLGVVGLYGAGLSFWLLGAGAFYLCLLLGITGLCMVLRPRERARAQALAAVIMIICACALLAIQPWFLQSWATKLHLSTPGGKLGYLDGCCALEPLLGARGGLCLLLALHGATLIYFARYRFWEFCRAVADDATHTFHRLREGLRARRERRARARAQAREWKIQAAAQQPEPHPTRQATLDLPEEEPLPPPMEDQLSRAREKEAQRIPTQRPPTARGRQYAPPSNRHNLLELMPEVERDVELGIGRIAEAPNCEAPPVAPGLSRMLDRRMPATPPPQASPAPARPPRQPVRPAPRPEPVRPEPPRPAPRPAPPAPPATLAGRTELEDYPFPSLELLKYEPPPPEASLAAQSEMHDMQQRIIEALATFKIDVTPGEITRGPSITRYEFYPPRGLRINRIANLNSDLMLATSSKSVNILAPIPGKNTVGIELENAAKAPVYLRELLQDPAFRNPKLRIPVALGKDVYGNAVIGDLAAMPHTLVAGTTGSGKSVCINSMILSMLYKFRPDELRLILVDPKVVEMQPYRKLPHLACPVVTNPGRVIGALRWAVNEMEHRYSLFSRCGVRNFEDFNNREDDGELEEEPEEEDLPLDYGKIEAMASEIERQAEEGIPLGDEDEEQGELDFEAGESIPPRLPYIVIIIDELADLMLVVKEDLENYIARLTQKARAAGIHLVVATQTPRSDVVTGIIKANIPSRIALKVSSPLDSRIILDATGAENLLGKGDLLFLPPGGISKLTRAQGAFVTDPEIASIVKFCASHAKQHFEQAVTAEMNNTDASADASPDGGALRSRNGGDANEDELYTRCVNLVVTERKASTSLLQRRFGIGYGKAARIMDLMQERGVISAPIGNTSKREILVESPDGGD